MLYVGRVLDSPYTQEMLQGLYKATEVINVRSLDNLPEVVNGDIQLAADTVYFIEGTVDLLGSRLVGAANTCILGASSENAILTSTGLTPGKALFKTDYTTPIRHISFKDVDTGIDIDGARSAQEPALDWTGVNFVNIPNAGTVGTVGNFIFSKGAFLGSQGLVFTGTVGTIGIDNSLFSGTGAAGALLAIDATATITRRFRIIYSSLVAFGSTVGVDVDVAATIPVEGYILDTVNFSGGGTYTTGVPYSDNKAQFNGVRGVANSAELINYYISAAPQVTPISGVDTPTKIVGTTTSLPITQRFSHTDNRATYIGALTRSFQVSATVTLTSTNNQKVGLYIAKNGVVIAESEMYANTDGVGRAESIAAHTLVQLVTDDYLEMFIENATSAADITVEYLNVIIKSID